MIFIPNRRTGIFFVLPDISGRMVYDVGLRLFACWGHGYLSIVINVNCQEEVCATVRSLDLRSPIDCEVPERDLEISAIRRPRTNELFSHKKNGYF
jgi:hypothetical protein